jgi:chorismate mutase
MVRGIRGATTVSRNEEKEILDATGELMVSIIEQNSLRPEQIACVLVTVTQDIDSTFPAKAIRAIPGWELVPLMGSVEMDAQGGLPLCIRLMVLANTDKGQDEIVHVYLNDAAVLRPDLVQRQKA